MYKRNNRGITLIALVITIIVLLILAGVSIRMLAGNNSILNNATTAVREKALGDVKEQVLLVVYETYTEYHSKEVTHTLSEGETLYGDTKAALETIKNKSINKDVSINGAEQTVEGGKKYVVTLTYSKDTTNIVTGTLLESSGVFNWD